jgi:hypothetical protein
LSSKHYSVAVLYQFWQLLGLKNPCGGTSGSPAWTTKTAAA